MPVKAIAGNSAGSPNLEGTDTTITDRLSERLSEARTAATARRRDLRDGYENAKFQGWLLKEGLSQKAPTMEVTEDDSRIKAGITGTFNMVVAAAVTLIVGIYVFSQISSTMPTPQNAELANATSTVKSTTGNAFTLGAVAVIVLVAALILSLIGSGFGGGGGGMRGRR